MDKTETTISFKASRLKNLNPGFWCKPISAHYVKFIPFTKYRPDAWHLSKSAMIILVCLAIVFYTPFIPILDFLVFGIVWNLFFTTGYRLLTT